MQEFNVKPVGKMGSRRQRDNLRHQTLAKPETIPADYHFCEYVRILTKLRFRSVQLKIILGRREI